jgi:uncharacterized protein with von Willebrand factor type A (vWA) domain
VDEVNSIKTELELYRVSVNSRFEKIERQISDVVSGQEFQSIKYEETLKAMSIAQAKGEAHQAEVIRLKAEINQISKKHEEERIARIDLAQYGRRNMVELNGVPRDDEEDCLDLVEKVARLGKFKKFDIKEVDVAHRLSNKPESGIIVLFSSRSA